MGGKLSPESAGVKYAPKARLPGGLFLRLTQKQLENIDNLYIDGGREYVVK